MTIMNQLRGAALIALAIILLSPALAFATTNEYTQAQPNRYAEIATVLSLVGLVGVVTVTYKFQLKSTHVLTSSTVAPTATQARQFNSLAALVEMAEGDTTATLTHNWNVAANQRSKYQPWLNWYTLTSGTALPFLSFDVSGTNAVTVTKTAANGTSGSFVVILQRPNTIIT